MTTETISHQSDRYSDSSTAVGVGKTREEYLKLFSRACYSPQYDRPYSSPISGFYDAINSSTSLILLNQRFKYSHIREQVLPEELASPSQKEYECESILVPEQSKSKQTDKSVSGRVSVDPYRHFESINNGQTKYWHNRRCTSSSLVDNSTEVSYTEPAIISRSRLSYTKQREPVSLSRCSQSATIRKDKCQTDSSFSESLCQYYRDVLEKSKQSELDLQQCPIKEPPNRPGKQNGLRRKSPLTKGQQIYLLGKYHVYDTTDSKLRRTNSYSQLLNNRFQADFHCKPQFRLNDPRDYFKYAKFLRASPSLTASSFSIQPNDPKSQPTNNDRHKSFSLSNNTITVRLQAKPIARISVQN